MFDRLHPARTELFVDPPPRGFFTYEDTVSGKIVLEALKEWALGYVYVYFHGWVRTKVWQSNQPNAANGPAGSETIDLETLFQFDKKVYQGSGKIHKGTRFEWPFSFDFLNSGIDDPSALPTSGKYGSCTVEYKVVVSCAPLGFDETAFKRMRTPDDILFQKDGPIKLDKLQERIAKSLGVGADQELQFVQIRPHLNVGGGMAGPFISTLDVPARHLPSINYQSVAPQDHGHSHASQPSIPFTVHLNVPRTVVEGALLPVYIRVTSPSLEWSSNPPPVLLTSFKMKLLIRTISRASMARSEDDHTEPIFDGKNLAVRLGPQNLDVGQLFSLTVMSPNIVPSFNSRLLQRAYDLPTELSVDIAGKTFKVEFPISRYIDIVSRYAATVAPRPLPAQDGPIKERKVRLKSTHIGLIKQEGDGPPRPDRIMEAALILSRALTASEIHHEFIGGSALKLLPYRPPPGSGLNDKNYDQRENDRDVILAFMSEHFPLLAPTENIGLCAVLYRNSEYGEGVTLQMPTLSTGDEHIQHKWVKEHRDRTDEVMIDPISLFNYRLDCAVNRKLEDAEVGDFQSLFRAFEHHLHRHRKNINVNSARIAAGTYATIQHVLASLEIELGVAPPTSGPQDVKYEGYGRSTNWDNGSFRDDSKVPPSAYSPENFEKRKDKETESHEEGLVKGFKKLLHKYHHDK